MRYLKYFNQSLNESSQIKEITSHDMQEIKLPNSAILANGEKCYPLSESECEPVRKFSETQNIQKFYKMAKLGPEMCMISLGNGGEKRILSYFKSDKSNYWIKVNGPGEFQYQKEKFYTTDDQSAFLEFIEKILGQFSEWCSDQMK